MPTANERKALWFLAFVALSGSGVRLWRSKAPPPSPVETTALSRQIARVDSARSSGTTKTPARRSRARDTVKTAAQPVPPVDLDRATAAEIEALPGIGPALAHRIVAYRDSAGSFGEIEAVCVVRGVGPALAKRLRPLVTFSGPRRPVSVACGDASTGAPKRRSRPP